MAEVESRQEAKELTSRGMGISIENYYELRATALVLEHCQNVIGVVVLIK